MDYKIQRAVRMESREKRKPSRRKAATVSMKISRGLLKIDMRNMIYLRVVK